MFCRARSAAIINTVKNRPLRGWHIFTDALISRVVFNDSEIIPPSRVDSGLCPLASAARGMISDASTSAYFLFNLTCTIFTITNSIANIATNIAAHIISFLNMLCLGTK